MGEERKRRMCEEEFLVFMCGEVFMEKVFMEKVCVRNYCTPSPLRYALT
jgi:hypothetical protein